jgi:hypothetical protein
MTVARDEWGIERGFLLEELAAHEVDLRAINDKVP